MIAVAGTVGVFGLAIGSFLNVVIHRVPIGLSVIRPASACPGCSTPIRGRDNVPLLSWLLLGGRCRACRMRISARYPAIEAITGLIFLAIAAAAAPELVLASSTPDLVGRVLLLAELLYMAAISVALGMIDIDVHRLPDAIVYPAYLVGTTLLTTSAVVLGEPQRLATAAIGMAASVVFYGCMVLIYPGGMGLGDVKLAGVLGMLLGWFGWPQLAIGSIAAFALGAAFGVVLMLMKRAGRKTGIPFGPWMLAGAWIGIGLGEPLARSYLSLVGLA